MSGPIKDGGPAFPCEQHETQDNMWNQTFEPGMNLRDYFAAKAMVMFAGGVNYETLATWSYQMADAMIAAREAKS